MTVEIWVLYVGAVAAMMSTPGPSQLLMLSNSLAHGFQRSIATAAGDLTANVIQMRLAGLGLAALISVFDGALIIIKWAGVAYLLFLSVTMALSRNGGGEQEAANRASLTRLWLQGFLRPRRTPRPSSFSPPCSRNSFLRTARSDRNLLCFPPPISAWMLSC